jgi:hypothetical protein
VRQLGWALRDPELPLFRAKLASRMKEQSKLAHSKEICSPSSLHVGNAAGGLDAERATSFICNVYRPSRAYY